MNTRTHMAFHRLDADDITNPFVHDNGHVSICIGSAAYQLHWDSFEEFERWVDRLHSLMAYEVLLNEDGTA